MRDWEVTDEVQKVVTPLTFGIEIQCNHRGFSLSSEMKFRHTRDAIHSHIDTSVMFCVSGWIGRNIN